MNTEMGKCLGNQEENCCGCSPLSWKFWSSFCFLGSSHLIHGSFPVTPLMDVCGRFLNARPQTGGTRRSLDLHARKTLPLYTWFFVYIVAFFFFFWLHHMAYRTLAPRPAMESALPAGKAWSLNHWTTREVPTLGL